MYDTSLYTAAKSKLGHTKPTTGLHAACGLDIADLNLPYL